MTRGAPALLVPEQWRTEIETWSGWLGASGQTAGTIEQRTYHLRRLGAAHPQLSPYEMSLDVLASWLGSHAWSANTRRMYRGSVRAFFRWALLTGRTGHDPAALLPQVRVPHGEPRPAPDRIIGDALDGADERTRLLILLASLVGLRRAELAAVHTDHVALYPDGWRLRVIGKGGRVRALPLPNQLGEALAALPPGYAFPGWNQEPMTPAHVGKIVSKALGPGWTTHTLRHRFASRAYLAERDIMAVRDLLGHANVRTTQIYTAVPEGARRAAVLAASTLAL